MTEDADSIRAARWLKSHVGERFKMAPSDNSTFEPRLRDQVFDTKDFQSCLTNTRTTLVLQGMPGVGKTTTMQGLIARVADRDKSRLNSKVVTAALCIRDTRDLGFERVISSALLYLLQVICKQVPDSMEAVKTLHQKVPAGRLPPASVITTAIQHVLTRVERTCIFIDSGADEFYDFSDLLAQLKLLQQKTNIGIVFTSDGDLDNFILEKHFRNLKFHTLTISANSEDIAAYLRKRFARKMDKGLVDSLASGISEAANGM
jgi:GTPase SAR1 family protein